MAKIKVEGDLCTATISEPDEDGDVTWTAICGASSAEWGPQPIGDTITDAENHVDLRCNRVRT
jgi:hypothetical protein